MQKEKPIRFITLILILATFSIFWFSGCRSTNSEPVISGLYAESNSLSWGESTDVVAVVSDPDGDELNYQWLVSRGTISGEGSRVTWTAPNVSGAYTVSVAVTDNRGGESSMTLTLSVMPNNPPVIVSLESEDTGCRKRDPVAVDCIAYDHDGDKLIYQWIVTGGEIKEEGPFVLWIAPDELGTYTITSRVSDGKGGQVEESLEIEVKGG